MRVSPAMVVVPLLVAAAARGDLPPWSLELRTGGGIDSNVLRDAQARERAFLLRLDGEGAWDLQRDLRLSLEGALEQNVEITALHEGELQLGGGWRRPLTPRLSLVVASLSAYRRELSVFTDGLALTTGGVLRIELAEHAMSVVELSLGTVDLEGGLRGDLKSTSGAEEYVMLGANVLLAARWVPVASLAVRGRYTLTFRSIDGLTVRNLMGGAAGIERDLHLTIHEGRLSLRWAPADVVSLSARGSHAILTDDLTGYYDGAEDDVRAGILLEHLRGSALDLSARYSRRSYSDRISSANNQTSETTVSVIADAKLWIFEHVGLFAHYRLERVEAEPLGRLFTRHVVLLGASGRLGWKDRP